MTLGVRMAKDIKYKVGDKVKLDNGTEEYDMLGQILELRLGDVCIGDDDSPLVGERELIPSTVEPPVANTTVGEAVDVTAHSGSPTRSTTRGLNVRGKRSIKPNMMETFIIMNHFTKKTAYFGHRQIETTAIDMLLRLNQLIKSTVNSS